MDILMTVLALLLGLGLGLALGIRFGRSSASEGARASEVELDLLRARVEEMERQRASGESVTALIQSLEKRVKEAQEEAARAERERISSDSRIREQIETMSKSNSALVEETTKLAGTLSNASTRGRYGEMQLEQLLSYSGLLPDVHYVKQGTTSDGSRPDVTVHLPGGGEIFVDSKFPFARFWDAASASTPEERHTFQALHAKDLLDHATALAKRGYQNKNTSPDFVVLFAPFESILAVALEADSTLLDKLFDKNVVIATPTTMLALLRTIGYGYSQRDMAHNAAQIRDLAATLLKRVGTVHSKLETLGSRLRSTANAYKDLIETAENSVFVPARKMVKLGVPATNALPGVDTEIQVREFSAATPLELEESEAGDDE
jgi:DNA recombination protein RmuC